MAFSSIFRKKLAEKFGDNQKSSIFASVCAYIWANGGCREIVPHLFFLFYRGYVLSDSIELPNQLDYKFHKNNKDENTSRRTI